MHPTSAPRLVPLLLRAGRLLNKIRLRNLTFSATGPTQREAILALVEQPRLSQADLARRLQINRSLASRIVCRLVETGIVEKVPSGDSPPRIGLQVTRYGGTFLAALAEEGDVLEAALRTAFSGEEGTRLAAGLTKAVAVLDHVLNLPPDAEYPPPNLTGFPATKGP